MTAHLSIADKLSLPIESVTQTFAILGIRGSGKTNTAVVMTEELLQAKQQVVVIDPVDVWWGLKSSKSGKQPGFPLPVIGGDHADVPLDGAAGQVLADFVTDTRASAILSLRHLSMNEQRRFAGDFARRLYERKGQQRSPVMLMVDEADEFVPQRLPHGHEAMYGAFDRLVRRGRSSGIGITLISQRPQVVNKDVLSQVETLVGMRMLHKLDRKALEAWIEAHDTEGRQEEFLASLASLGRGDAWIWSPSWLNVFERVHIRERSTFDSSATPKAGESIAPPKQVAPLDLEKLREQMSSQIEKAKAEDPRLLRAEIARLQGELKKQPKPAPAADPKEIERAYQRGVADGRKEADRIARKWEGAKPYLDMVGKIMTEALSVGKITTEVLTVPARIPLPGPPKTPLPSQPLARRQPAAAADNGNLTGPEQRILDAIAWMESIGIEAPEQTAVAFLAGYTYGGGAFNNPRGALRTRGLVEYSGDGIRLTDAGQKAANHPDAVLDTAELQRRVMERLPGPERKILQVLLDHYPEAVANDACAEAAGYAPNGGAYNNPRGRLRTLGLIEYPQSGYVRARDLLFLQGGRE